MEPQRFLEHGHFSPCQLRGCPAPRLKVGQRIRLLIDGMSAMPFSMSTLEPDSIQLSVGALTDTAKAHHIRRMSREPYGRARERVQKEVQSQYVM
jgi:hypothetical protein